MATVAITNHSGPEINLCDPRGGFSVMLKLDKKVEFEADDGRLNALMGHLVNLVNWGFPDKDPAFTVKVVE